MLKRNYNYVIVIFFVSLEFVEITDFGFLDFEIKSDKKKKMQIHFQKIGYM